MMGKANQGMYSSVTGADSRSSANFSPGGYRRGILGELASRCVDENQLVAYAEGRLSDAERDGVGAHLESCTSCQLVLKGLAGASVMRARAELDAPAPTPKKLLREYLAADARDRERLLVGVAFIGTSFG